MTSRKKTRPRPLLGAHMSIAGGIAEAPLRGASVGCQSMQIFTRSARQWASKPYSDEEVRNFRARQAEAEFVAARGQGNDQRRGHGIVLGRKLPRSVIDPFEGPAGARRHDLSGVVDIQAGQLIW